MTECPRCPVCSASLELDLTSCAGCETQHHLSCWNWAGGCAVYGCRTGGQPSADRNEAPETRYCLEGNLSTMPFPFAVLLLPLLLFAWWNYDDLMRWFTASDGGFLRLGLLFLVLLLPRFVRHLLSFHAGGVERSIHLGPVSLHRSLIPAEEVGSMVFNLGPSGVGIDMKSRSGEIHPLWTATEEDLDTLSLAAVWVRVRCPFTVELVRESPGSPRGVPPSAPLEDHVTHENTGDTCHANFRRRAFAIHAVRLRMFPIIPLGLAVVWPLICADTGTFVRFVPAMIGLLVATLMHVAFRARPELGAIVEQWNMVTPGARSLPDSLSRLIDALPADWIRSTPSPSIVLGVTGSLVALFLIQLFSPSTPLAWPWIALSLVCIGSSLIPGHRKPRTPPFEPAMGVPIPAPAGHQVVAAVSIFSCLVPLSMWSGSSEWIPGLEGFRSYLACGLTGVAVFSLVGPLLGAAMVIIGLPVAIRWLESLGRVSVHPEGLELIGGFTGRIQQIPWSEISGILRLGTESITANGAAFSTTDRIEMTGPWGTRILHVPTDLSLHLWNHLRDNLRPHILASLCDTLSREGLVTLEDSRITPQAIELPSGTIDVGSVESVEEDSGVLILHRGKGREPVLHDLTGRNEIFLPDLLRVLMKAPGM